MIKIFTKKSSSSRLGACLASLSPRSPQQQHFVGPTMRRSWKEASNRRNGPESYRFGDITRSLFYKARTKLLSFLDDNGRQTRHVLFQNFSEIIPSDATSRDMRPVEKKLWLNLFNACYACGMRALSTGLLNLRDVEDQESWLFLGMPALAILECCLRSAARQRDGHLLLADGTSLRHGDIRASVVDDGDSAAALGEMLELIVQIRSASAGAEPRLSEESLNVLRVKILHASGDASRAADNETEVLLNQLCGKAIGIATQVSSLPFFRFAFLTVLEAIEERGEQQQVTEAEAAVTQGAAGAAAPVLALSSVESARREHLAQFGRELLRRSLSADDDDG